MTKAVGNAADHWQGDKRYPYAQGPFPANSQTLGDGVMHQSSQSTHYWWCWVAIGEMIAYILVMNLAIPVLLEILPGKHVCLQHDCLSSLLCFCNTLCTFQTAFGLISWHPHTLLRASAAYGSDATHMVTDEALAERDAALRGDPGTDLAVKVDMPPQPSMHQAKEPAEPPTGVLETQVGTTCLVCYKPFAHYIAHCTLTCCLRWSLCGHQLGSACIWGLSALLYYSYSLDRGKHLSLTEDSQQEDLSKPATFMMHDHCCQQ